MRRLAVSALLVIGLVLPASASSGADAPEAGERPAAPHVPLSFGVATLNVLGSQFTTKGESYPPGVVRAGIDVRLIRHRHLYLVAMQEVQPDQLGVLERRLPGYQFWPSTALGRLGVPLQIAVRTATFELVGHGFITTPFDGRQRPLPWVLLRHRSTGRLLYVIDVHNSAKPGAVYQRQRTDATRKEIALVRGFTADRHGVILLGDANATRTFFCQVVGRTSLNAAAGGSVSPGRGCDPPAGDLPIDWIMGAGPFSFSRYRSDRDPPVVRATDHPLNHAVVTVEPRP